MGSGTEAGLKVERMRTAVIVQLLCCVIPVQHFCLCLCTGSELAKSVNNAVVAHDICLQCHFYHEKDRIG